MVPKIRRKALLSPQKLYTGEICNIGIMRYYGPSCYSIVTDQQPWDFNIGNGLININEVQTGVLSIEDSINTKIKGLARGWGKSKFQNCV